LSIDSRFGAFFGLFLTGRFHVRSTHASIALNAQARIESAAFLTHFDALVDPCQSGKDIYPLNEVLLLC